MDASNSENPRSSIKSPQALGNSEIIKGQRPQINSETGESAGYLVKGVQPLYVYNDEKENHRDAVTKDKFDSINKSVEEMRNEVTDTMTKISRQQEKMDVNSVLKGMTDYKEMFIRTLQKTEKKKEDDNDIIMAEIKKLKTEVQRNYEESQSNYRVIKHFQSELRDFEKEIKGRLKNYEENQNEQFERVYGMLINLSLMKRDQFEKKDSTSRSKGKTKPKASENDED